MPRGLNRLRVDADIVRERRQIDEVSEAAREELHQLLEECRVLELDQLTNVALDIRLVVACMSDSGALLLVVDSWQEAVQQGVLELLEPEAGGAELRGRQGQ